MWWLFGPQQREADHPITTCCPMNVISLRLYLLPLISLCLTAAPVTTDVWYHITGDPGPLSNGVSFTASLGTAVVDPGIAPWTFTAATPVNFTVVDACFDTEQFEVFDFGVSLGTTSTPGGNFPNGCVAPTFVDDPIFTLATPSFSKGIFILDSGAHSITITNISATGTSGAFIIESTIPEPTVALMTGSGILLGVLTARYRRRVSAEQALALGECPHALR